jgi:hypothetical protein
MERLLLISGSFPPVNCGVGDYTYELFKEIRNNINTSIITTEDNSRKNKQKDILWKTVEKWNIYNIYKIFKDIRKEKFKYINIQYPSKKYDKSIFLILLFILIKYFTSSKLILTQHEFSIAHILRKIYVLFLIFLSDAVIVPSLEEKKHLEDIFKKIITILKIYF